MTKTNHQLQKDVIDELTFDPAVDASNVGVTAKEGVVTLTGTVQSYPDKLAAERAVKRVAGVHGIAEEMKIEIPSTFHRTDAEIAKAALAALASDITVPYGKITAKVENGWLTLEGEVAWQYQRDAAKRVVEHLFALRGVTNGITVAPIIAQADVKTKIRNAFERAAEIDANKVQVEIAGTTVTLRGNVHSWIEHDDASYAAFSVPGVRTVLNETHVV